MHSSCDSATLTDHIVVCGLGHVGYRICCLLSRLGQRGVVITLETTDERRLATESHFSVIIGDARSEQLLHQAGISRAKAILIVTDDDMANVSIALDARRANPKLSIVVRMFDQGLAAHLERNFDVGRILSASALATPSFAAAALGGNALGEFEIGGNACLVESSVIESGSEFIDQPISRWAKSTNRGVIALERGGRISIRPSATTSLAGGDRLTHLRFITSANNTNPAINPAEGVSPIHWVTEGIRAWRKNIPGGMRVTLAALAAVVLFSVALFRFQLGMPWVDSLYFVITTITTVGYGDYNLMNAPPLMKLYGSFLMLCGAGIMATLFGIITTLLMEFRFRDLLTGRCARFKGHIIVAGLGNIGFRLVKELIRSGETAVAIEWQANAEFMRSAGDLVPVVSGNAKETETLIKAGIAGAKAIVAATDDDLTNLSIALAAKQANPQCRSVLRIFDFKLAHKMRETLKIDSVLSVSAAAAPTFAGAVLCPDVLQGIELQGNLVLIFQRPAAPARLNSTSRVDENEFELFVRHAESPQYHCSNPEEPHREGDRIVGVKWFPLDQRGNS